MSIKIEPFNTSAMSPHSVGMASSHRDEDVYPWLLKYIIRSTSAVINKRRYFKHSLSLFLSIDWLTNRYEYIHNIILNRVVDETLPLRGGILS
jgi:hypothetical protein